jgi:hypothetical protein
MNFFPTTSHVVEPWFQTYSDIVSDPTTWRHMFGLATTERAEIAALLPAYERSELGDVVSDIRNEMKYCDDLLDQMRTKATARGILLAA